jgi:hypothetical protein
MDWVSSCMFSTARESPSSIALSWYSRARRQLEVTPFPFWYIKPSALTAWE